MYWLQKASRHRRIRAPVSHRQQQAGEPEDVSHRVEQTGVQDRCRGAAGGGASSPGLGLGLV